MANSVPPSPTRPAWRLAVVAGAVVALLLGTACSLRLFRGVDNSFYDFFLEQLADTGPGAPEEVVIVAIDEDAVSTMKRRFPWPRSFYAQLLDRLNAGEAAAVGFDMLFIDETEPAEDAAFAQALIRYPKTVLGANLEAVNSTAVGTRTKVTGQRLLMPCKQLREHAPVGLVNFDFDPGLTIRRFTATRQHQDQDYPSFALAVYQAAYGRLPELPPGGSALINFVGPPHTFTTVPASQVLKGTIAPDFFRGKLVLVGVELLDQHDYFATPLTTAANLSPGVEVQANLLAGMLRGSYCHPAVRWPQVLLVVLLVALFTGITIWRAGIWPVAAGVLVWLGLFATAWWCLSQNGAVIDLSYPLAAVPLALFAVGWQLRRPQVLETKVGPYKLYDELGRGGMAVVYRARHPKTKREVALKQILPEYAGDETVRKRFLREVEVVRNLNHPNIIEIIDAGEVNNVPYYAMALISGPTLERHLQDVKRLPGEEVSRLGGAIARALARAHANGLLHRDIKPANIMLTEEGEPKLMDFGIARKINDARITQTGELMGTPLYLAPEQIQGAPATYQSDIYSLGATLYHLAAGRPPFFDEQIHVVLNKCITEEPVPLRQLCQSASEELEAVIMQCLKKGPRQRPASMHDLARLLDPLYIGEIDPPPQAAPPAAAEVAATSVMRSSTPTPVNGGLPLASATPLPGTKVASSEVLPPPAAPAAAPSASDSDNIAPPPAPPLPSGPPPPIVKPVFKRKRFD